MHEYILTPLQVQKKHREVTKKKWGNWVFVDNLTLINVKFPEYEVDLEQMTTKNLLDWVIHLSHKVWNSRRDIGDFVYAIDDIYDVQSQIWKINDNTYEIKDKYLKLHSERRQRDGISD